jgi:hypothetical protein
MSEVLNEAARGASDYRARVSTEPIPPEPGRDLGELTGPLPEDGSDADHVIKLIDEVVTPATTGFSSPRFYGWVIGGRLPGGIGS